MLDMLEDVGEALYGSLWQRAISKDIGVTDRTVRRWVAGDPIPDGLDAQLKTLVDKRITELKRLRRRL